MNVLIAAPTEMECSRLKKHYRTVVTGVGAVATARALTVEIERERPAGIVVVGIGGAYPESGLALGEVICAESETFGDLGVETPEGFVELREFIQNTFPLALFPAPRKAPFVTVATCSGTDELSARMHSRTQGWVENMEGAAAAQIGTHYGIPVGEIRGISNFTGRRDRAAWKVPEAANAAQEELLNWLRRWSMSLLV